jgi:hypothetical protein
MIYSIIELEFGQLWQLLDLKKYVNNESLLRQNYLNLYCQSTSAWKFNIQLAILFYDFPRKCIKYGRSSKKIT